MVSQAGPPCQRIFLHHLGLLHCLLRRADAGGNNGEKKEVAEHDAVEGEMAAVQPLSLI